ncbi:MAG: hypothetical protein Q7V88_06675 [Actinomycetota bacterium]|nr:hypothetical protein [Actinomycetota bacterium]
MSDAAQRQATVDAGDVYEAVRQRFIATVRGVPADALLTMVPAAPEWRVRDVLAHAVGLPADLNAQRFPAAGDEGASAWTARQVAARAGTTIDELVAEWDREAPGFEDGLRLFGYGEGCHFVADLHAHHQDVRGALRLPADDHALTVAVALDHYLGFLHQMLCDASWGVVAVHAGAEVRVLGTEAGANRAQVAGTAFEVLRSFSARRSPAQIRGLRWRGDVEPLLAVLQSGFSGGYALPPVDLVE